MSSPGMASVAENMPGCVVPLLRSMELGEPSPIKAPRSAVVTGVGIAAVASPNRAFISSKRMLAVSGYKKKTNWLLARSQEVEVNLLTYHEADSTKESVQ